MGLIKWHFVGLLPEPADWRYARNTVLFPLLGGLAAAIVAGSAGFQAHLPFLESLWLMSRALALGFVGLFIPFVFSRLVAVALLPRFERGLRTALSFVIFAVLFVLNFCVTLALNPTSPVRMRALDGLFGHGPSLFQAFSLLIEGALIAVALWRFGRDPVTHHLRAARLLAAVSLIALLFVGDWWLTRERWTTAPENQSADARHELAIVIPGLDANGMKVVLADARLESWKEQTRLFAEIIPGNGSQMGEIVTFVSGLQPWEHGIRDQGLSASDETMLQDYLRKKVGESGELVYNRTLGSTIPVAEFFDRNAETPCRASPANRVAVSAFSWMLPLYAQIPEHIAAEIVPSYSCSHALAPLATLAEQALAQFAREFRSPVRARSLWVLNLPRNEGEDELTRFDGLANTLVRFQEILSTLSLDKNTRITLVGLGEGRGSLAVISAFDLPALRVTSPSVLQVGTAQAASILRGVLPPRETLFYSEDIVPGPAPRSASELTSTLFLARRTLRCAWREGMAQMVMNLHLTPTRTGIHTAAEEFGGIEILAPVLNSRAECTATARKSFENILARDVSLLDPRPLEAMLRRTLPSNAWAPAAPQPPAAAAPTPGATLP